MGCARLIGHASALHPNMGIPSGWDEIFHTLKKKLRTRYFEHAHITYILGHFANYPANYPANIHSPNNYICTPIINTIRDAYDLWTIICADYALCGWFKRNIVTRRECGGPIARSHHDLVIKSFCHITCTRGKRLMALGRRAGRKLSDVQI